MSERDSDFRVRPGRIRTTRVPKAKSFLNQVLRAAKKVGACRRACVGPTGVQLWPLDLWPGARQLQP